VVSPPRWCAPAVRGTGEGLVEQRWLELELS
jgi:hypothetical protein